ncbi:MAG TPA: hypothetical protein DCR58_05630 [Idiomarina baltica]|uniref:diguanylate cyclase n=1 Tax=Idiomarina baltica TaxID=190892 RepID=A0A348WNZ1_9GAMM|nr:MULTISPECIES: GGDEF domain-containing protein [Idiomarina]MBL73443.1 hypothetical protein [Idiomarinaceae bacterium]HAR56253.1 hypothetical protein [Idiomarina baltica]
MSLQQKYNDINWLTGQFRDSRLEASYRDSIKLRVRHDSRLALMLVSLIFAMFAVTDYNLLGHSTDFFTLISMRAVVVSSCVVLALILGRVGNFSRKPLLHALPLWVLAAGIISIVPLRPESLYTQITAVVVAIMAFYLLIPSLLTIASWASGFLSVGFIVASVAYAEVSVPTATRLVLLLIMANIVGYCALLRLEILQRKQFSLLNEERDQNLALQREVEHRKSLEAQLRRLAERDTLTELDTRSHFIKRAEALLERALRENTAFCLLMIDVDHFKQINDTWGHTRGDEVLKQVAKTIRQSLRRVDVVGRFGGEEFIVAMPNTHHKEAVKLAQRLTANVNAIELPSPLNQVSVSITVGIAMKSNERSLDLLIQRADEMLYKGKRNGRNRVELAR